MKYIEWNKFKNVKAFTTTRDVGNIGFQIGDEKEEVKKRRSIIANELKIPVEQMIFAHQCHSDIISEVTKNDVGKGSYDFKSGVDGDALYTKETNLALGILHADCVPLFFYIPSKEIVCVIHAGYEGTLKEITEKSIRFLKDKEQVDPNDIYVHIGPSRKFYSYKITQKEADAIISLRYEKSLKFNGNDILFDMPLMNYLQLLKEGVAIENITITEEDTYDNPKLFSAHQKTPLGRVASLIMRTN